MSFTNLPSECTIKIYTIDGDLVKTIEHTSGTGTAFWDIRSEYNQLIATGVYFYHVSSKYGEKIGKFAIVR
ncbi:MAG: T9SS type A sorting domain-containing protein [Melioribacteraceae bacterium]|nr:T9SS type A sorting domain-containing protein [Melioribacteraceae bacterium]